MLTRVISSVIALPILLFFVIMGGVYLEVALGLITLIALHEFFGALKVKYKPYDWPTYIFVFAFYLCFRMEAYLVLSALFVAYMTLILIMYVLDHTKQVADVALTLLPTAYILFFIYHVNLFSRFDQSFYIWMIFIVSWGADTGGYFFGRKFGKKKLAPTVSPKKTVEGALGGMLSASIFAVALSMYFDPSFAGYSVIIAIIGSVISIFGDLVASKIKREMGIKDFGKIMPGHGGIMDRFDSLILVTPFVYYAIALILWIK